MLRKIDAFMKWLASILSYIGAIGISIIMFMICIDIFARLFLNSPIVGTPEIVQNSLAAIAFLMIPWATHLGQHVRSTIFKDKLSKKPACVAEIFAYLLGALLFIGIIYSAWKPMLLATSIRDFQGEGLRVPIYPVWWIIILGSSLSFYQCLSKIIKAVGVLMGKDIELEEDGGGIQI